MHIPRRGGSTGGGRTAYPPREKEAVGVPDPVDEGAVDDEHPDTAAGHVVSIEEGRGERVDVSLRRVRSPGGPGPKVLHSARSHCHCVTVTVDRLR